MSYDAKLVDKLLEQMENCVKRISALNKSVPEQSSKQTPKAAWLWLD